VGLAVVTGATYLAWLGPHLWIPRSAVLPAVVLAAVFALTEGFTFNLRVRRGGHALSVSEIPMVVGLLVLGPAPLVLARFVGSVAGLTVVRRQRGGKLAFNTVLVATQSLLAPGVFVLVSGGSSNGIRAWLAAYLAMIATEIFSGVLVTAAISLSDDPTEWRRLPAAMRDVWLVFVTTTVALVSGVAAQHDERALLLLAVVSFLTYLAYRGYVRQGQGHAQVEELYAFTRALDGSTGTEAITRTVLNQARDQLRAASAELILPSSDGYSHTLVRLRGQGEVDVVGLNALPVDPWWWPARSGEAVLLTADARVVDGARPVDGMAVPVPMSGAGTGVLLVTGSLADLPTFRPEQLRLFQALANHASVSLIRAGLLDQLRLEVAEKEHLALHDTLTGLPNRRHFQGLLEASLAAGRRAAVMLMDLDRFKEINDSLGHDVGDALLREVGRRLREELGERGVVARLGGDEFAVLLHDVDGAVARATAEELAQAVEAPIPLNDLVLNTRASVGIALAPAHGDDGQTLIRRADMAMYVAKESRSSTRVYQPQDDQNAPQRLALLADLREAVLRRELTVAFQPKIDPMTGRVAGAEALVRWHHAERGNIGPDDFIPVAEHAGLIRPLTLHVLEEALQRCAAWRRGGHDLHVAVNLSPNSLLDDQLPDIVARLLSQVRLSPAALTLEITESTIMADPAGSMATLDRLHALGVKLAIDDFGTGYSSLGRLRELPIHEVKIDKSFIQRVGADHRDRAVVRSAIQLGHALDLTVVAEGVDDHETYAHLAREGCDLVQGYLVSRPLPADEFSRWLARHAGEPSLRVLPGDPGLGLLLDGVVGPPRTRS
jgi:diguanylate cyclase (GGDEF)-like protein